MEKYFSIKPKSDPILLYGENAFAKKTYQYLLEKGYDVKGYIDQKYQEIAATGKTARFNINNIEKYALGGGVNP